jgi:hypothetical protein
MRITWGEMWKRHWTRNNQQRPPKIVGEDGLDYQNSLNDRLELTCVTGNLQYHINE